MGQCRIELFVRFTNLPDVSKHRMHSTQRATKEISGTQCPNFRYLIRRNPPMSLRVAYRRVLGLIGVIQNPFEVRCVVTGCQLLMQIHSNVSQWFLILNNFQRY
jgi:hypothetical protein